MSQLADVGEFLAQLKHPLKAEIEAIRKIILAADARICESIKWNAPSFYISDHFATFKLYPPQVVQVVLHRGAKVKDSSKEMQIKDPSGLLKWASKDRCMASFTSMEEVESSKAAFIAIIKAWIKQL